LEPDLPLVFDGHNDTLLNLHLPDRGKGRSFFERSDLGHVDLSKRPGAGDTQSDFCASGWRFGALPQ
jgi:hypothetical protein